MKFALFSHLPWPEGVEPRQVLAEATEQAQLAEEVGFHSAWFAEHHFSRYGIGSSLVMLSSIAARTSKIRLGTAVIVPPLHHPVQLAEDTAALDVVSNGRLDVGFGRGTAGYEYRGYNVDQTQSQAKFQETIKVIRDLWTTPDYSYEGQYVQINRANLVPPPLQQPHPPIYIAATRTPATLEYVVSTGHPLIVGVVLDHADAIDLCQRYVKMSQAAGHNVPMSAIPFFRYFYVADTEEEAVKVTRPAMSWTQDMIQWRRVFTEGSEVYQRMDDFRRTRTQQPPDYEHLREKRSIIGNPDQCVAQIKELEQQGVEYFGCNFDFGGVEQAKVLRSMELFAKEVMPHFS